jgi:hypothetical protein
MSQRIAIGLATGTALALAPAGCESSPFGPEGWPPGPPDVRAYVTGAALDNLDSSGRFSLPPAAVEGPYEFISEDEAREIARGVVRTWYANPNVITLRGLTSLVEAAEHQHGASIAWDRVVPGESRPYFAESHLEPLPEIAGNPTIRQFGPQFQVPFYVGDTPVVSVSVSAYATNLYLNEGGFVRWEDNLDGGGEFSVAGIPITLKGVTLPPYPEVAVAFAYQQTGVKVAEVPELGLPGNRVTSLASRWRLKLAEPVEFVRLWDGGIVLEDEIYVGVFRSVAVREGAGSTSHELRLHVAAPEQPAYEQIGQLEAPIRDGYAVDLEEVVPRW